MAYTVSGMIIMAIILPIALSIVLQITAVQNFIARQVSGALSDVTHTRVSIGHVDIAFFTNVLLEDVLIEDQRQDTMIYAGNVRVGINGINFLTGKITLGTVTVGDAQVNLYQDSLGVMNVERVFSNFKPATPTQSTGNLRLSAQELNLINTTFRMEMFDAPPNGYGVNWQNIHFSNIDFQAHDISVLNYNIWLKLDHLDLVERCGWKVENLSSSRCGVDSSGMYYADMRLETSGSTIELDSLNFLTTNHSWWDWNDFEHKMILKANIRRSQISSSTLSYVIGQRIERPFSFELGSARLTGPLCNMQGEVRGAGFDQTRLDLRYAIQGLPLIEQTNFQVEIIDFQTLGSDIERAYRTVTGGELSASVSQIIERGEQYNISGVFDGLIKDFKSSFIIRSLSAGQINASLQMKPLPGDRGAILMGSVGSNNLDVGHLLNVPKMESASFAATMQATVEQDKKLRLTTQAHISKLRYSLYDYHSLDINGQVLPAGFSGTVACSDTNLTFQAKGMFDVSGNVPSYDFDMDLERADLSAIGFNSRDSISVLSAHFSAQAVGRTLDDVNGDAKVGNILYINHLDTVRTGAIYIESRNSLELKQIKLFSDFMDAELKGRNSFSEIFRYFSQSLERFLPSFPDVSQIVTGEKQAKGKLRKRSDIAFSDGYYQLDVDIKQANNVAGIFVPGLEIAQDSKLNFFFNPYLDQFSLRATADYIESPTFNVYNMELDSRNHADSLSMFLTSDMLIFSGLELPNLSLIGGIKANVITLGGRFVDNESKTNILLRTTTTFNRTDRGMAQMRVALHPTPIIVNGHQWSLSPSEFVLDTTGIGISNFALSYNNQNLEIDGKIGRTISDTLNISLESFDLKPLSALVSDLGYKISGFAGGNVQVASLLKEPRLFAAVDFTDVVFGNYPLGNPKLRSTFDLPTSQVRFSVGEDLLHPPIMGFYGVKSKEWGGKIYFENFDMVILEPMLSGILTASSGHAKVDLELRGKGELPELSGTVDVKDYSAMVDYTKARYKLSGLVNVKNNRFELSHTPFSDQSGGKGIISAYFDSKYFKDMRFGVNATFENLLALNTTIKENTSFYGKAWGTGYFNITGTEQKTSIVIAAQTAGSSQFILPLSSASTIESADFIRFVNPQTDTIKPKTSSRRARAVRPAGSNELDIKIDLNVLPNTQAQIEFDARIGDVIKGRGEGNLSMHINPSQDLFNMTGSVQITQGDYLFTLLTIFQRHFTINQGATLVWNGAPANPQIDMSATYKVKTSLDALVGNQGGQRTMANIDCSILLSGNMTSPEITFAITAPSADPETQNLIRNSINTQEALSMQFLSLILSNSFMPDAGASAIGTMGGSFVGVTGLEFLTNQLSQMISSEKVNIRLGYRMPTTSASEEYYAGVGTDIIQDVLSIEVDGNYATGNNPSFNSRNPFTVDAYLTWNINKKRTLKLQGFTRTIDRFDETQGLQESGVGIYFRQDFSDFKDLKSRLQKSFKPTVEPKKAERKPKATKKKKK